MKKALKFLFGGIALVIVLLIAAPFFISADTYKSLLTAKVKKMTGRTLVIAGDASLTLFPNVALKVENVSLSNPEGFADKDLTTIGKLTVDLALMPLLDKRIEMQGATLEHAVIALEERADGTKSWEMMPAVKGTEANAAPAEKKAKNDMSNIVLGSVSIKDSKVTYRKAGKKPVVLENINVSIDSAGFDTNLDASIEALYNGATVGVKATIENPKAFLAGTPTNVDVNANVPHTSIAFKGTAAMAQALLAKGAFDASIKDMPALTQWATGKASGGIKAIAAKGTLNASGKTYALTGATLKADSVEAAGDIAVNLEGKIPSIKGKMMLGSLSLDALSPASTASAPAAANAKTSTPSGGWSTAAIDLSGLRVANADISVSASDISSGKVKLGATSFRIKLNDGALNVKDIATSLYGGTASGDISANASGAVGANLAAKGIQIEPLMTALSGKSRLAGTTNLTINVSGSGKSQKSIVSSLGGKASLRVEDGAILGINIGKFLRDAKEGFLFSSNSSERTDFAELTANFAIASGVVSNNDLSMKAPLLRLGGSGTVSLPPKTIDYTLMPKIAATSQGQGGKDDKAGIAIPLRITGPWSNPSITPDLASALQENLKNPEAIKENVKAISESVKDLNSKDDLKRALGDSLNKKLGGSEGTSDSSKPDLGNILKGF